MNRRVAWPSSRAANRGNQSKVRYSSADYDHGPDEACARRCCRPSRWRYRFRRTSPASAARAKGVGNAPRHPDHPPTRRSRPRTASPGDRLGKRGNVARGRGLALPGVQTGHRDRSRYFEHPLLETRGRATLNAGLSTPPDSPQTDTIAGPHQRSEIR